MSDRATEESTSVADPLLHDFFQQTACRWPERIALDIPPGHARSSRTLVTYAELATESDALAEHLRPLVAAECLIVILLPRTSRDLFVAQLAVLKAGAAYTCLDPSFPDERVREILEDAGTNALLTDAEGMSRMRSSESAELKLIEVRAAVMASHQGETASPPWLTPASLAYVIYTSGTTGRPKGVMIEHHSIANLVASDLETFRLSPADRVGQGSSAAYDSSIEETWLAFAAGATLVIMDDDTARLGPDLIDWLQRERIHVFCPPPTLLRATGCDDPETALPDLKLLYVGGEALPRDVADRWSRGRELVNGYGPTECTVTCLREKILEGQPVTIGSPVKGATARVLNEAMQEVPHGEQGELCMGGIGLARGYWKQLDLTAAKFINHPVFGRLYRTGDLVHRDAAGRFFYHGRIDSQVKLRGYRIELGEIESRLAEHPTIRAAACKVQDADDNALIVAFVVLEDSIDPPSPEDITHKLTQSLPGYMVPARIGFLEHLPTTVGGKLNRAALPRIEAAVPKESQQATPPRDPMESRLAAAFQDVLKLQETISIHQDFFNDLGGDSLRAALLVTQLRNDPATAWATVRDIYETRSVAALAERASASSEPNEPSPEVKASGARAHPLLVTMAQAVWLIIMLIITAIGGWWVSFEMLPALTDTLGLIPLLLLAPLLGMLAFAIYTPVSLIVAVAFKRLLIGRYQPMRTPVWSGFYLRHWIVERTVRLVPWAILEGTVLQKIALRALGARIGRRVHIGRGVDLLRGGWDLLEIGDEVSLGQDSAVRTVELDDGDLVIGPVSLHAGATLDTRAGVASHTVMEEDTYLSALSSLPPGAQISAGERWDGIPARPAGRAPVPSPLDKGAHQLTENQHGWLLMLARAGLGLLLALPLEVLMIVACIAFGLSGDQLWAWLYQPNADWTPLMLAIGMALIAVPLTLAWMAVVARVLGRVRSGSVSLWSFAFARARLKTSLVDSAGNWLSGTLFWPLWLRLAGMRIGRGCEISTIIGVVPELVEIGPDTFFADGIYLGCPRIQQGVATLAKTTIGTNTFLGNHVVVTAGQRLPDDILIGISTPADSEAISTGTSWFGHPPFELPRREVVEMDRSLTHEPSAIRYWNRVFWEALRFALPIVPLLVLVAWLRVLAGGSEALFILAAVPLATLLAGALPCLFILALKWLLLGRVRPGQHALWSCWCSRWDFLYVAWGQHARHVLEKLEGTLLLTFYLRAIGMKIGKRVVLGPGFSQVVDPDMLQINDGATVNAMFQAHTFEDRVLKTDHVVVGKNATLGSASVPLYGSHIGEGTHVAAHSVIMKHEHLLPGIHYEGAPTRASIAHC